MFEKKKKKSSLHLWLCYRTYLCLTEMAASKMATRAVAQTIISMTLMWSVAGKVHHQL